MIKIRHITSLSILIVYFDIDVLLTCKKVFEIKIISMKGHENSLKDTLFMTYTSDQLKNGKSVYPSISLLHIAGFTLRSGLSIPNCFK